MRANANDKIKVLDVSESCKLYNIPDGKRVIAEFTSIAQPIGKNEGKWRRMTNKMVKGSSFIQILNNRRNVSAEKK
jgi:hypothetical protein